MTTDATDPTPTPGRCTPGLPEAGEHLDEIAAELGATRAAIRRINTLAQARAALGNEADLLVAARSGIEHILRVAGAAQLAILGIEADPEGDLAPAVIEVTDGDVEASFAEAIHVGDETLSSRKGVRAALETFAARLAARGAVPAEPAEERCADCGHRGHGGVPCGEIAAGRYGCPCGWTGGAGMPPRPDDDQAAEVLELLERNLPSRPAPTPGHPHGCSCGECGFRTRTQDGAR